MAEQENCARITRAAKKRAAAAAEEHEQPVEKKKQRVVLAELRNLSNVVPLPNPSSEAESQTQKNKTVTSKSKKAIVPKKVDDVYKEVIDAAKSDDPQMCGPYAAEIYEHFRTMEADVKRRPLHNYMEKVQNDIDPNMRGVLVDWLVKVADQCKLVPDTLYLAVNYIDRFLSVKAINRHKLQLLGVSSMLIARKYEENPPNMEDFYYVTDNTYTRKEVVTMESDVLNVLKFEVGSPTTKTFLRKFTRIAQEDYKTQNLQLEFLGYYLAELSLLDYYFLQFLPSKVAASVIFLARYITRPEIHPWNSALQRCTGYKAAELLSCAVQIHALYSSRRGHGLHAVREKYRQHRFKCVASMPSPPDTAPSLFQIVLD